MVTPKKRTEFERNIQLLSDSILQKKFFMSHKNPGYLRSLTAVNYLPNKRLNFGTVNETARLAANHRANMPAMLKRIEDDQKQKGL